jgi:hypothetical protein
MDRGDSMTRRHGISEGTYRKFIIDAGEVRIGFTDFSNPGTLIGATRGGSSLTIEQEIREMEVDGARGPVKGSRRITMVKAALTVNLIEASTDIFKKALVGASSADFNTSWDQITRSLGIADSDYLSDITILGDVSGYTDGMGVKLSNVLADGNFELTFADKDEGVIPITFTAHFDPADLEAKDDIEPWSILWPSGVGKYVFVGLGSLSGSSVDGIEWTTAGDTGIHAATSILYGGILSQRKLFVIADDSSSVAISKDNGKTWATPTTPPPHGGRLGNVNGGFILVNDAGFYKSPDGEDWELITSPAPDDWKGVTSGNGLTIAAGVTNLAVSDDLLSWDLYACPISPGETGERWDRAAMYADGKYVFASALNIIYSADGTSWSAGTMPSNFICQKIVYGGGKYVATGIPTEGTDTRVYYSTDLNNWTQASTPLSTSDAYAVVYAEGKFTAVLGREGYSLCETWTSTDGINWSATPRSATDLVLAVTHEAA